jgi:hypothetical protein
MDVAGIPLNELHCPTCGEQYQDFILHVESEGVFDIEKQTADIKPTPTAWHRFLVCPNRHKWSVKVIWRTINEPDKVLLGSYLGDAT